MIRPVRWTKQARKELLRLDVPTRRRILDTIDNLATESRGDVVRLHGISEAIFRLRVGGWRIFFCYEQEIRILVLRIRPRGDAYKA